MAQNARLRTKINEIQVQAKPEREWWEKRRETLRTEFMKELDEDEKPAAGEGKAASVLSDEEAVLVEGGGPTTPGAQGGKKKKKGKK